MGFVPAARGREASEIAASGWWPARCMAEGCASLQRAGARRSAASGRQSPAWAEIASRKIQNGNFVAHLERRQAYAVLLPNVALLITRRALIYVVVTKMRLGIAFLDDVAVVSASSPRRQRPPKTIAAWPRRTPPPRPPRPSGPPASIRRPSRPPRTRRAAGSTRRRPARRRQFDHAGACAAAGVARALPDRGPPDSADRTPPRGPSEGVRGASARAIAAARATRTSPASRRASAPTWSVGNKRSKFTD